MKSLLPIVLSVTGFAVTVPSLDAQDTKASAGAMLVVKADQPGAVINRNIYGQFSEHLGHCIYEGVWVGENSPIPNTRGIRNDVVAALKKLKVPVLRWPGGCFADEYHWKDGIGPSEKRPSIINTHWGGMVENNALHFGQRQDPGGERVRLPRCSRKGASLTGQHRSEQSDQGVVRTTRPDSEIGFGPRAHCARDQFAQHLRRAERGGAADIQRPTLADGKLSVELPAKSVVVLELL